METVKLTPKERASFIFQLRILQKLSDSSEFSDYEAKIAALERGYELHYSDVFDMLYDEGLSADECRSVLDILEMYRGIIFSYKQLKETSLTDEQVKFPGFDGNFEAKQMLYVQYFIEDLDRYHEIKELSHSYYNSHSRQLNHYQARLQKWEKLDHMERYKMSEEQIRDLLNTY